MNTETLLRREQLAREIFTELNNFVDLKQSLRVIIKKLKEYTGFEAISIRLLEDDDYPYLVQEGFTDVFIHEENSLCSQDLTKNGTVKGEKHKLECLCGKVIQGNTDTSKDYYTAKGSYFTNSSTIITPVLLKNEPGIHIRNRCNAMGYESIGLFPIKTRDENLGLIQLNDKRKNLFDDEMIAFLELVGEQVGISLENAIQYEKLKAKNIELQNTLDEIKIMQDQLLEAKKMTALADLVTGIAHEVYSPIDDSVILLDKLMVNINEIAQNDASFKAITEDSKHIHEILTNIKGLVKSFRSIVLDQFIESRHLINLKEFIGDIIRLVKPGMKDKKIEFQLECNSQSEIMSFSGVLSQVFIMLFQNSYNHGFKDSDKGIITISCAVVDDEFIAIRVADNGCGIREDIRYKLFEPFFTTNRKKYSGLGLAVAANLVKSKLNGKLELDESTHEGAAFLITIPV